MVRGLAACGQHGSRLGRPRATWFAAWPPAGSMVRSLAARGQYGSHCGRLLPVVAEV